MIVLIDGYNVLKAQLASSHASQAERHRFIQQLIKFAARRGHRIVLVFDGGDHPWSLRESMQGHEIVYSGYKQSADAVLRQLMVNYKGHDAVVVSSDREVSRYARHNGLTAISSQDFLATLQQVVTVPPATIAGTKELVKTTTESNPDLDTLMELGSRKMPVKRSSEEAPRERSTKQDSHRNKQEERQKKKL
ncbi:NYN domain-containing protein [Candidatus Dependentiae bacterium]|nr:NYN domain-containing protein [Candidatus Dependentiae bacterium]